MSLFSTKPTPTTTPNMATDHGPTLSELEAIIAAGLDTVEQVGTALMAIKVRKLYRDSHGSWDAYLADRWKMTAIYAQKLMEAGAICKELRDAGLPAPTRESHTRELRKVPTENRPEAWKQTLADAGGDPANVTAELIATKAAAYRKPKARRKAPRTIVLKGKGWTVRLERRSVDVDPIAALTEALDNLNANTRTSKAA